MDMNINLNITAIGICEAVNNLASAILGMGANSVGAVEQAQPATRKPRATKTTEAAPTIEPATEITPEPVAETATAVEPIPEVVTEPTPAVEDAPKFTLEAVRAKLGALSAAGHAPAIKELFGKFGAKKLTEVPAENYAELMAAAEELG